MSAPARARGDEGAPAAHDIGVGAPDAPHGADGRHRTRGRLVALIAFAALVALVALVAGGYTALVDPPVATITPPSRSDAVAATIDWAREGDAALATLQALVRVDTSNPPGDELRAARVVAALLADAGLEASVVEFAPGRANLIARLPRFAPPSGAAHAAARPPLGAPQPDAGVATGATAPGDAATAATTPTAPGEGPMSAPPRDRATVTTTAAPSHEGPLCLTAHLDVATAEAARWPAGRGPFAGVIVPAARAPDDGDVLWGRGALDMKGMAALELHVLLLLHRLQVPLARDVVLLLVGDEEVDGAGMRFAVERQWGELGCAHAINEGGLGVQDAIFPGQTVVGVSVGEKGHLWLRLVAEGATGHGSTPLPGRAPDRLRAALDRVAARTEQPALHPSLQETLARVGRARGGLEGAVLRRPWLVRALVLDDLAAAPPTRALVANTISLTGFTGMKEPNVVPSRVAAQYDVRLLPDVRVDAMLASLQGTIADVDGARGALRFEVISAQEALVSPMDDDVLRALLAHGTRGLEDAVAGPILSPGSTDSTTLRAKGVRAYGFVPFVVTQNEAKTMHGDGERVSRGNVRRGLEVLFRIVYDVAAAP